MDDALAYFLDLRLRARGKSDALAIIDRCLVLLARIQAAAPDHLEPLERELEALRRDLLKRYGPPRALTLH